MTFYFVRHGETEWNRSDIFRGRRDIPLNENGRKQARRAGEALLPEHVEKIYSSPLRRSAETADLMGEVLHLDSELHPGLIDLNYGLWTGLSISEVARRFPGQVEIWKSRPLDFTFPEGECLKDVQKRTLDALEGLAQKGRVIAVVSHLAVLKALFCALLDLGKDGFWKISLEPAGISRFDYQPKGRTWNCRFLNDLCHLKGIN